MKYIRTKDTEFRTGEILKVLHEDEDYFECEGTFEKRMGCKAYVKKEIVVKSADTIEELCDEFVVVGNKDVGKPFISKKDFKTLQEQNEIRLFDECELFGAIWVVGDDKEPILKSVAKMVDGGDFELNL